MFHISLRKKFIIGTAILILLVGGALGVLVKHELHSRFQEEVQKRGLSVARYISEAAEIPLITENEISLDRLVNDYRKLDKDIEYIFITAPNNTIAAHTFGSQIPEKLIEESLKIPRKRGNAVILVNAGNRIFDISTPIQDGALGSVHIGLYEGLIDKNVEGVLIRMLPFVLGILVLGTIAAVIFASAITRPIALLTTGVERLSMGEFKDPISIHSMDEIGKLATAFNSMADKLRSTTVSREYMEKLIDSMHDILIVISPTGVIQNVNRAYCDLFGEKFDTVAGHSITEFQQPDAPIRMASDYAEAIKLGSLHGIESNCRKTDGEIIPMLYSLAVMNDDNGEPEAVICAAQNISGIKKTEKALQQKQLELEEVNRNLEDIVASRTAELAIGNEGLRAEVAERQKKTEELRKARDIAESANRSKSEFLANMSHEMRTPLNSIIGGTEYLNSVCMSEEQQRCLAMIRHAGDSLLILINDLIDLSRIEAGQFVISNRSFNLQQTLERVIEMVGQSAEQKKLTLSLDIATSMPTFVKGDQIRLQQVLVNLVANAIKFTESGGKVTLETTAVSEEGLQATVTFVIKDTGIGIDPNKLDMIFDSFAQADTSITRRFGGSGLGLAISRKLVEAMGGAMSVDSLPGVGSSFSFTLPFQAGTVDAAKTSETKRDASTDTTVYDISTVPKRVLLVDDSRENLELMHLLLRSLPLELHEAANGQEAVDLCTSENFDLVFMDIQMPVMDGYTATRMIRRNEEKTGRKKTTIIALTAHAYESDIQKSIEAGCNDHIAKPFKKPILLDCIRNYL
ncbi:MAG: ATP-binding protein [Desulfuromonadaceae bacterium]|nr:ATP-binding protein [Desulfuromonadaceae bacterium]MDD2855847.1 ATP-binding protein [Desulfuromonadaceae bacterium]